MSITAAKDVSAFRRALRLSLIALLLLWCIRLVESALGLQLAPFGIYPRDTSSLLGVVWAPLIHGSFAHLFANSLPLLCGKDRRCKAMYICETVSKKSIGAKFFHLHDSAIDS